MIYSKKKEFENFSNSIHTCSKDSTLTSSELYCVLNNYYQFEAKSTIYSIFL